MFSAAVSLCSRSVASLSPLTEQQRHVLQQHEQQLQQLQQLLTSQPLNPVRDGGEGRLLVLGKAQSREENLKLKPDVPSCPRIL